MQKLEIIKVKCDNEQGFFIINKDDFDKDNHVEFSPKAKSAKPKTKAVKSK